MEGGIMMRDSDGSQVALNRTASLKVVEYVSNFYCASCLLVGCHFFLLRVWLYVKNGSIASANQFHILWEIFVKKCFSFQWTVYRSDCFVIKWKFSSVVVDFICMILMGLPVFVVGFILFGEIVETQNLTLSQLSPYFSLCFYGITLLGISYKVLSGENQALQKEIADKYKIKLVIPYWFWGAESTYSFDDFMEMVIFKSTDGYYITGENCFIFDERTLGNPVFTNELSLLCAKHGRVNILQYNTIEQTLTAVPVCYFFSKAPNAQAVTAPVYGKITQQLSNSNFYWMFVYLILFAGFVVSIVFIITQMTIDVPCYNCCRKHSTGGKCYQDIYINNVKEYSYECSDVCEGASFYVTESLNDDKYGQPQYYQPYNSLRSLAIVFSMLIAFMVYMLIYIAYFFDKLFVTAVLRIDSDYFHDSNYHIMEKLKAKSCYKVLEEAFRDSMGGFAFDFAYFSVLNNTRYYLTESIGVPVSTFRVFLNVYAIKQGQKISLRLKIGEKECILDSEFNPYVPTGKATVVIYYNKLGYVWLATEMDKEDVVNLSTKVLLEVILKY